MGLAALECRECQQLVGKQEEQRWSHCPPSPSNTALEQQMMEELEQVLPPQLCHHVEAGKRPRLCSPKW